MRKTLGLLTSVLFLAAMIAFPAQAQAQYGGDQGSNLYLGVQGGLSSAQLTDDFAGTGNTLASSEHRTGLSGGVVAEYRFDPEGMWGIRSGLRYTQRGAEGTSTTNTGAQITSTVELDYLEVPALVLLRTPSNTSTLVARAYAGPVAAMEVNCGLSVEGGGNSASASCDEAGAGDVFDDFDVLSRFGAGVGLQAGPGQFTVDARYDYGLLNLTGSDNALVETRNEGFAVQAGYLLPL